LERKKKPLKKALKQGGEKIVEKKPKKRKEKTMMEHKQRNK
jgi:hypothetical protein